MNENLASQGEMPVEVRHFGSYLNLASVREYEKDLSLVGQVDPLATQAFRDHHLLEGAFETEDRNGVMRRHVYGLIDPEETVVAVNSTQAAEQLRDRVVKHQEIIRKLGDMSDYNDSDVDVIIGSPEEPSIASRRVVKQVVVLPDGGIRITVQANANFPKSNRLMPAWSDDDPEDSPKRHYAYGGRTGEAVVLQRITGSTTRYLGMNDTFEFAKGDSGLYAVSVDAKAVEQLEKTKPSYKNAGLLKKLLMFLGVK